MERSHARFYKRLCAIFVGANDEKLNPNMRTRSNETAMVFGVSVLLVVYYAYGKLFTSTSSDVWLNEPEQQFETRILQKELDALAVNGFAQAELTGNYTEPSQNQTIHIVLIVADSDNPEKARPSLCERVETLLKSILIFYEGELHVHLLTNTKSGDTFSTLFRTWAVARVRTSFYNIEADQRRLEWLKYVIPDILPDDVEKAIFIDTDMMVLEDLSVLHSYFNAMDEKGIMFATASDQYNRKDLEESFGEGGGAASLNSGLVLYNLKLMREGNWSRLWRETGVWLMNKLGNLKCPQDLLLAVALLRPDTYMRLPCAYNFQIGPYTRPEKCLKSRADVRNVKIPHWTGKLKFYDTIGYTAVFSPIYRCVQRMDGYEFEEGNGTTEYRTITNLRNTPHIKKAVTLAGHTYYAESIELMQRLNSTWSDPISLAVCGSSWQRAQLLSFIFANPLHDAFNVHFVHLRNGSCPAHYLRRTAINESRTDRVLLSDAIVSLNVDSGLRKTIAEARAPIVLRNRETYSLTGVLLEASMAQRVAAREWGLEQAISSLRLRHTTVEVKPGVDHLNLNPVNKWEMKKPSDAFCRREIDKRRRASEL